MNTGKRQPIPWLGIALVVGAALSWSTAGLFPRIVHTDVFTTLFWRSLLGGLSVLGAHALYLRWRSQSTSPAPNAEVPASRSLWRMNRAEAWMCVCSTGAMLSFISAFYFTRVADVVFIYSAFPVITLLLSAWLLHTRVRLLDLVCALTVVLGMGLIVRGQTSLHNLVGAALSLAATLLFALITIGIQRHPQANMVKITYMGTFLAALCMAPFATFVGTRMNDLAWLWLYGVLNVAVGFGLYLLGVRRLKPVLAALVCMVEIPLAPLWVFVLFGETIPAQSLIGGSVIVAAVLLNIVAHGRASGKAATPS